MGLLAGLSAGLGSALNFGWKVGVICGVVVCLLWIAIKAVKAVDRRISNHLDNINEPML